MINLESIKGHTLRNIIKIRNLLWLHKTDMFYRVGIETTNECNRRCSYCPMSLDKNFVKKVMKKELFYKIIKELKQIKFKGEICLVVYGEPLLDKRIEGFVRYVNKQLNIKPHFFTNGDFLTIYKFRKLINCGLKIMIIAQHGKVQSKNLERFFKQATKEDLKYVRFDKVSEDSCLVSRSGIDVKNKMFMSRFCRSPSSLIPIRADGIISLCCNDYFNEVIQGDVNKQSLIEIWNNPINKRRRIELSKGILTPNLCKVCVYGKQKKNEKTNNNYY